MTCSNNTRTTAQQHQNHQNNNRTITTTTAPQPIQCCCQNIPPCAAHTGLMTDDAAQVCGIFRRLIILASLFAKFSRDPMICWAQLRPNACNWCPAPPGPCIKQKLRNCLSTFRDKQPISLSRYLTPEKVFYLF